MYSIKTRIINVLKFYDNISLIQYPLSFSSIIRVLKFYDDTDNLDCRNVNYSDIMIT